ncbi:MAG: KH domain-containing protein [Candidatus Kariarchaeaceae archaeon]|jgi:ribosomal RNA assembly protein
MENSDHLQSNRFSNESSQFLRIPLKRIGAVIGLKGSIRKEIEEKTSSIIIIDSDTGEVEIRPGKDLKDPVLLMKAKDIVKAIGRGFASTQAIKLAEDDFFLEIIRLKPFVGTAPNRLRRVRARVIGTKGRTKNAIEELTSTALVVAGSTVSLIGNIDEIGKARGAVVKIINGATIESVIGALEDKKKQIRKTDEKLWKSDEDEPTMKELFPEEEEEEEDIFKDFDSET